MAEPNLAVGGRLPRLEAEEKITGDAEFLDDIAKPGTLHAAYLQSPLAHARIVSCDTDAANALPGVRAVLTGKDLPRLGGSGVKDMPFLAHDKVRYIGEPVAVVAADSLAIAQAAVPLIKVEFDELPAVLSMDDVVDEAAQLLHEVFESYKKSHQLLHSGNVLSYQEL